MLLQVQLFCVMYCSKYCVMYCADDVIQIHLKTTTVYLKLMQLLIKPQTQPLNLKL